MEKARRRNIFKNIEHYFRSFVCGMSIYGVISIPFVRRLADNHDSFFLVCTCLIICIPYIYIFLKNEDKTDISLDCLSFTEMWHLDDEDFKKLSKSDKEKYLAISPYFKKYDDSDEDTKNEYKKAMKIVHNKHFELVKRS